MTPVKTHSDYSAFLESLKVKNEGPEEMHGWRFDKPTKYLRVAIENTRKLTERREELRLCEFIEYLIERIVRAESNAKPETLAEDVKAFMRAGMDAQKLASWDTLHKFRRLSEPGK